MASSSSIDLPTQLQYYVVRDTLLGHNEVKQDVKHALELASTCQHPDAQWLTEIFAGKDVKTKEEARDVFLAHETDPRALCFAAVLSWPWDNDRLRRAAEMGFAFAQAQVAWQGAARDKEKFPLSLRASLQGERDGFHSLGWCYQNGWGCERNEIKEKENYLLAAKLNYVQAMVRYGELLDDKDPQRWHWLGLAAARGSSICFLSYFGSVVDQLNSDPTFASAVFMIGRTLTGNIDAEKGEIFFNRRHFNNHVERAKRAVAFFSFQCAAARAAVDMWCLMARRFLSCQVNKDIRKKIGMLIWEARELANYKESSL